MTWLPDGEKKLKIMFIRFDTIHERDRQTHTHTDTHTQRHRMTARRGKNVVIT